MKEITAHNLHELDPFYGSDSMLQEFHFSHLTLPLARLEGWKFVDCVFDHVVFSGKLEKPLTVLGSSFRGCSLDGALWSKGYVRASTFSEVSFRQSVLAQCTFHDCRFEFSDFRCLTLDQSTWMDCQIVECQFDYAETSTAFFVNTDFAHPKNSLSFSVWKESHFVSCGIPAHFKDPALSTLEACVFLEPQAIKARPASEFERALEIKPEEKVVKKSTPLKKEIIEVALPAKPAVLAEPLKTTSEAGRFSFIPLPGDLKPKEK